MNFLYLLVSCMIVGLPKEIKTKEFRVALTPSGVQELTKHDHTVLVEKSAGEGSGFKDEEYVKAGATLSHAEEIFSKAELICKVKEPIGKELEMLRENQILFTYLHLAASREVTDVLLKKKVTGIAYETVTEKGMLPLLAPMSEVAGRMSVLVAAEYLQKDHGGRGTLISGVPGTRPAKVVILGGGFVGGNAATIAYGVGANVTILEKNIPRVRELKGLFPRANVLVSNSSVIEREVLDADVLIGAVLIPGAKAPKLISRDLIEKMKEGSVFVDVAIDQGGCSETSKPTSHDNPVYKVGGVTHYCVTNMPGAYPRTSTTALTNSTLHYVMLIAEKGLEALKENEGLMNGLNTFQGKITHKGVAEAFGLNYEKPTL